ncbi:MAG: protein kinase [Polyangiaceae bacterium]
MTSPRPVLPERSDSVNAHRAHDASSVQAGDGAAGGGTDEMRPAVLARLGRELGGCSLAEVLGIGGTAAVYRGVRADGSSVAVKVLHSHLAENPRPRKRFLREAYIANRIEHPGVPRILEGGEDPGGTAYLLMELCEGQTLEQLRAQAPEGLAAGAVVPWIEQLLTVLSRAHAMGIVHRDIKPSNLMVTPDGRLRVLDFGLARVASPEGAPSLVTRSGAVLGTVQFMPPEQALGVSGDVDARSDVWAVGATAFALLTGRLVHGGRTVNEALVLAATHPAPPIRSVRSEVPAALASVVDRALSFDRASRFADAGEMLQALRSCGEPADSPVPASLRADPTLPDDSLAGHTALSTIPRRAEPPPGRRAIFGVLAGLAAVLSAGALWLGGAFHGEPGGGTSEQGPASPASAERGQPEDRIQAPSPKAEAEAEPDTSASSALVAPAASSSETASHSPSPDRQGPASTRSPGRPSAPRTAASGPPPRAEPGAAGASFSTPAGPGKTASPALPSAGTARPTATGLPPF